MTTPIDELIWRINSRDPLRPASDAIDDAIAAADASVLPRLVTQLQIYLEDGNVDGRDIMCQMLTALVGIEALPTLVRASAQDLGDDQDALQHLIIELIELYPAPAADLVEELLRDRSVAVREVAVWAWGFVE
ncbi:hypothetical protein F4553_007219 [Allocatelliglobosispora scoriae]|uniref:HEAT repeat domain-containing protein n=1 Tax=Allocatelliglobosispora scoriae TaxID=643052 RepID=A0A841C1H9_9ACTN|nr:hypothetical protein [Allocatelliglobosispora scoriae]MBB5873785.1 hypothetical protein [Allocatelliglobosispora scoriae]